MNSKFREELIKERNTTVALLKSISGGDINYIQGVIYGFNAALYLYDKHSTETLDRVRDDLKGEN